MNIQGITSGRKARALAVLLITLLALGLRLYAAVRLDVDHDEHVYLAAAASYAGYLRLGQLNMLAWDEHTYEHPALYKILYGVALLARPPLAITTHDILPPLQPIAGMAAGPWAMLGRYVSVFWGTLAVLALSLLNPLAGLFLAVDTLSVKYTSEMYIEALPAFSSLLCVLAYDRWFRGASGQGAPSARNALWLFGSATLLGITVASKYVYGVVGLAIAVHFFVALAQGRLQLRHLYALAAWGALSLLAFFLFDPYLWPHPVARLLKSVTFHQAYEQSEYVARFDYPFWQPLRWLAAFSTFYDLGPASAFVFDIDAAIFALALIGLPSLFRRQPLYFWWLVIGIAFLLLWATKWPQYTLVVMAPFSLSAALGLSALLQAAARLLRRGRPTSQSA